VVTVHPQECGLNNQVMFDRVNFQNFSWKKTWFGQGFKTLEWFVEWAGFNNTHENHFQNRY
jgi:hypothetical protein